jgi:hypothetical protein
VFEYLKMWLHVFESLNVRDELVGPAAGVGVAGEEDDPLVRHAALVRTLLLADHLRGFRKQKEGKGQNDREDQGLCLLSGVRRMNDPLHHLTKATQTMCEEGVA